MALAGNVHGTLALCSATSPKQVAFTGPQVQRQLDVLEARLFALVAEQQVHCTASLREVGRLQQLTQQTLESRLDAVERKQASFEQSLTELKKAVRSLQESTGAGDYGQSVREASSGWQARLELGSMTSQDQLPGGETIMLAVQELESLLQTELKDIRKRFNNLQDTMEDRVLVPLHDCERRIDEHDHYVKQCLSTGEESVARFEEHEFKLGVLRTKLDVQDQKVARLDSMRWSKASSLGCPKAERDSWTGAGKDSLLPRSFERLAVGEC